MGDIGERSFDFRSIQTDHPVFWKLLNEMYSITKVREDSFWSEFTEGWVYKNDLFYFFDHNGIIISVSMEVNHVDSDEGEQLWKYTLQAKDKAGLWRNWMDAGFKDRDTAITRGFKNGIKKLEIWGN